MDVCMTYDKKSAHNHGLTILIVEDDRMACGEMEDYIDTLDDVHLAAVTDNSNQALDMVTHYLPDAIILDLELHRGGGNGLLFLQKLSQTDLPFKPYILVTTNNCSDITYEAARNLGADFIMAKHESDYSGKKAIDFLRLIQDTLLSNTGGNSLRFAKIESPAEKQLKLTKRIYRELDLVGISRKNIGFQYLVDAILITTDKPETNLSAVLGAKYHKSASSVERAMQNAINRAWHTSSIGELEAHYTAKTHSSRGVPTIMEFVFYYADLVQGF